MEQNGPPEQKEENQEHDIQKEKEKESEKDQEVHSKKASKSMKKDDSDLNIDRGHQDLNEWSQAEVSPKHETKNDELMVTFDKSS